jgi:glycosyltransferase involved in cell wall biosynthesis
MLVSIIITNHNYERYLAEAIESALNQDYRDVEVIVVDDGSTDGSRRIIERYGGRIIPILKDNGGQCSSFNVGFARSRGEVVMFLDADDVLLTHGAALHVEHLRGGAVKSCGYMEVIDAEGRPTGSWIPRLLPESGDYLRDTLQNGLDTYQTSFTSGHAWSRTFLSKALPLPENDLIGADGYLTAVDRLFGRLEFIHEPVAQYRLHTANKGPVGFRFDPAHLRNRVQRKRHRIAYAERWLRDLGYQVEPRRFRRIRDWRLSLMMHSLSLMEEGDPGVSSWELVSAPFRTRPLRVRASAQIAATLGLIRLLPKRQALALARYVLERTPIGRVSAKHHARPPPAVSHRRVDARS